MKKQLSIILALSIVLSTVLTGCGKGSNSSLSTTEVKPTKKTVITFANWNKEENWKDFIAVINAKVPEADVQFQFVDNKQYDNVISTQLAAGEGPDLLCVTQAYIKAGYVLDITSEPYVKKYSDSGLIGYRSNDKVYAIPANSWFEGMFYNKEIFNKFGLKAPKNWAEYMALHETLKKNGVQPQVMGAKSWESLNKSALGFLLNDFYQTNSGKTFDKDFNDGKATFTGNFNESLKTWSQLISKGYITKDMLGLDYDQALDAFATGKAAMWESGPWAVDTIKQKNPNLKLGMFPFVGTKEGAGWLVGGTSTGFGINSKSKNIDIVKKVLAAITTPEAQNAMLKANPGSSSFLVGLDTTLDPIYTDCAATFKAGNVYDNWDRWTNYNNQALIQEQGSQYQKYLGGKTSLDEAVSAMDKKASTVKISE
ncbi:extracellular solute-binding protein [bacterium AH-315-N14]|nr:extracellular solute-binding protein [bacterium AH-315-N14]